MKTNNKGFAPRAMILIIVAALMVGGGAYYWGNESNVATQNTECTPDSPTAVNITSPNGGEGWQIGQTYDVTWTTCNAPADAWVRFSYSIPSGVHEIGYKQNCFGRPNILATEGSYSWTISNGIFGCSDAGGTFNPDTSFKTKVKVELYTGARLCDFGMPMEGDPCTSNARTLHASDESDKNFTLTNK